MILVHPLSTFVSSVERHLSWLWPIFWALSLFVNGIAWIFVGFGNAGGYCTFDPAKGGAYFTAIFQFVPRAIVVIVVVVLYTHLFFFLRRVNMFNRATTSQSRQKSSIPAGSNNGSQQQEQLQKRRHQQQQQQPSLRPSPKKENGAITFEGGSDRRWSRGTKLDLWYKWKRSLSDASANQGIPQSSRTGSASTQGKSSVGELNANPLEMAAIEMVDYSEVSPKSKPTDNLIEETKPKKQFTTTVPIIQAPPQSQRASSAKVYETQQNASFSHSPNTNGKVSKGGKGEEEEEEANSIGDWQDESSSPFQPMAPRRDVRDFGMTSPPQEHLRHYSLSPAGMNILKRSQGDEEADGGREVEGNGEEEQAEEPSYENMLGNDWTWGMPVGEGSKLQQQQQQQQQQADASKATSRGRFGSWFSSQSTKKDRNGVGSGSSSTEENGVESLGSTLNRQASILLLLYPLVYCLLFSVSIIRIIVDLSTPTGTIEQKMSRNRDALHSISRWTIFAQGAIDAIIFQIVERSFRMRLKRRRRIAAGEIVDDPWWRQAITKVSTLAKKG